MGRICTNQLNAMNDEQDEISHKNQADAEDESLRFEVIDELERDEAAIRLRRHREALTAVWLHEGEEDVRALSAGRLKSMRPHRRLRHSSSARLTRVETPFERATSDAEILMRNTMTRPKP